MPDTPYFLGAVINAIIAISSFVWFLWKLDWRSMLLSAAMLFCAVFWWHIYPVHMSHARPICPIVLNAFLALGVVSRLSPPQPTRF